MSAGAEGLTILAAVNVLLAWGAYVVLMSGQVSLGQAGFMAIGAYAAGVLTVDVGLPLWLAMLAAGLLAGLFGVAVGFPALRVRTSARRRASVLVVRVQRLGFAGPGQTISARPSWTSRTPPV